MNPDRGHIRCENAKVTRDECRQEFAGGSFHTHVRSTKLHNVVSDRFTSVVNTCEYTGPRSAGADKFMELHGRQRRHPETTHLSLRSVLPKAAKSNPSPKNAQAAGMI